MSAHISLSTSYRIEISGWDVEQNFFVEKANLDWSEEQGKKVQLRHPLRNGAVVFIRLIAPSAPGNSFPIAYQIENVGPAKSSGTWEVRLVQLRPRSGANGNGQGNPSKIRRRNDEKKRTGKLRANGPALHLGRVPPGDRHLPGDYGGTGQDQRGVYELQTELGAPSEASKEDLDFLSHLGRKINNQQPN